MDELDVEVTAMLRRQEGEAAGMKTVSRLQLVKLAEICVLNGVTADTVTGSYKTSNEVITKILSMCSIEPAAGSEPAGEYVDLQKAFLIAVVTALRIANGLDKAIKSRYDPVKPDGPIEI